MGDRERDKETSDYPKNPMLTMLEATLYLCHQTIQFTNLGNLHHSLLTHN